MKIGSRALNCRDALVEEVAKFVLPKYVAVKAPIPDLEGV